MREKEYTSIVKQLETVMREQWDCDALTDYGSDITYKYSSVAKRICYLHLLMSDDFVVIYSLQKHFLYLQR